MKAYVTRWWDSQGVVVVEGAEGQVLPGSIAWEADGCTLAAFMGEWFATPEEALQDVEAKRAEMVARLQRQIDKLKAKIFIVWEPAHA